MSTDTPPYLIEVHDRNLARTGQVDVLTSMELTVRRLAVGAWTITVPLDQPQAALLYAPGARVAVYQPGETRSLTSGPVWHRELTWDASNPGSGTLTVSGPDDMLFLAKRLAFQVPSAPATTAGQSTAAYDLRPASGTTDAETVIRGFVDANAGPGALTARRVPGMTLAANGNRGSQVVGRARMDNLLDLLRGLALVGGVECRLTQTGSSHLFTVTLPVDHTGPARFSPQLGNLRQMSYTEEGPETSAAIVGGAGEGVAQTFAEYVDEQAVADWDRVETYVDAPSAALPAEMSQAGLEELIEAGPSVSLAVSVEDTEQWRLGRDWWVGDRVTVEPRQGVTVRDAVAEARLGWAAAEGPTGSSTVGSLQTVGDQRLVRILERVNRKLRRGGRP